MLSDEIVEEIQQSQNVDEQVGPSGQRAAGRVAVAPQHDDDEDENDDSDFEDSEEEDDSFREGTGEKDGSDGSEGEEEDMEDDIDDEEIDKNEIAALSGNRVLDKKDRRKNK